ncbi:MAG: glycosyltransferase family 2 protein [Bacteroidetes bacterium]|nr:glycosyltransferase family 2 protein [Bacteroidota bacterium]
MKISIITPTYNRADLIERAIKSILNQTYQNFEMIIIDDGSSDSTSTVVSKYLVDPRIKYIISPFNGGVNSARNIGIKNISDDSELITFLDSDDEFCVNALDDMIKVNNQKPDINYFRFPVIYTNGKSVCNMQLADSIADYEKYLSILDNCGEWVVTLRKKILENGFLYEESVNGSESIAYLRLSKTENVYFAKNIVRVYHVDNEGISRPKARKKSYYINQLKAVSILLNEFGEDLNQYNKKNYINNLYERAILNLILCNRKLGLKQSYEAVKYDIFNIGVLRILMHLMTNRIKL